MGFSQLVPLARLLQQLADTFDTETADYMGWRNRLTRLRHEADQLQRSIREPELARHRSGLTIHPDDQDRARVLRALERANLLGAGADRAMELHDRGPTAATIVSLRAVGLDPGSATNLPDYVHEVSRREAQAHPFAALRPDAEDLFALMEQICHDRLIDYGLWRLTIEQLEQRTRRLFQRAAELERPATWSDPSEDGDREFVIFALGDAQAVGQHALEAIEHFETRRRWFTDARNLESMPPMLPCMAKKQKPRSYEKEIELRWVRKWVVAKSYGRLSLGTIYAKEASRIDEQRLNELPNMRLYDGGPTLACDIIRRQSALNLERLRRYFRRAPLEPAEALFYDRLSALHFCLIHNTDAGAHLIHRCRILSTDSLRRLQGVMKLEESERTKGMKPAARREEESRHLRVPPKVKSTERNLNIKGDSDFTFFRLDISTTRDPVLKTRFGSTTFLADAECLFQLGWVSLHDQVYPFKEEKTRKVVHEGANVRVLLSDGASELDRWRLAYGDGVSALNPAERPGAGCCVLDTRFQDEIFFGGDVLEGVALSLIRELRRCAGLYPETGMSPPGVTFGNGRRFRDSALTCTTPAGLRSVLSALFRIEAKLPVCLSFEIIDKDVFFDTERYSEPYDLVHPVPAILIHPLGDGRYYIADRENPSPLSVETHVIGFLAAHSYALWEDKMRGRADALAADALKPAALYWNVLWYLTLAGVESRRALEMAARACKEDIKWNDYNIQGLKDPRRQTFSAAPFTGQEREDIRIVIAKKLEALKLDPSSLGL